MQERSLEGLLPFEMAGTGPPMMATLSLLWPWRACGLIKRRLYFCTRGNLIGGGVADFNGVQSYKVDLALLITMIAVSGLPGSDRRCWPEMVTSIDGDGR